MAQSLANILVHIVFSTKGRQPLILPEIQNELYGYMVSICKTHESPSIIIGGTADHIHALVSLNKDQTVSTLVQKMKTGTSKWIKTKSFHNTFFAWQAGYGAFSVGASMRDSVIEYIKSQKEHHKTKTFQDEYRELLVRYDIKFNEEYVWD